MIFNNSFLSPGKRILSFLILLGLGSLLYAQICPSGTSTPRVILAGDSWAQYMWDDNSHNVIFDKYGHNDKRMISESEGADPGPGYTGSAVAISGSEARDWVNTASFPYINNLISFVTANPEAKVIVLSIGGNDLLAGQSGGGWYKDMETDAPGSEQAVFDLVVNNTWTIMNSVWAVDPNIEFIISSYDYPNFNTGFLCFLAACPMRNDMSRDPVGDLVTDQEINTMMVAAEQERIDMSNVDPRVYYDNSLGLMHYFYGNGVDAPGATPYPGNLKPTYAPYPAGNPTEPSLRGNFRIGADPIHLDIDGYLYKATKQVEDYLFDHFRGNPDLTLNSQGGLNDGWTDGLTIGTNGIRWGDDGANQVKGILSFDTSPIPDGSILTGASIYLHKNSGLGNNPIISTLLGNPELDIISGSFGGLAVEVADHTAPAGASNIGCFHGTLSDDDYAIRIDIDGAALGNINEAGETQFRLSFPLTDAGTDLLIFEDGDDAARSGEPELIEKKKVKFDTLPNGEIVEQHYTMRAIAHEGLANLLGNSKPVIDLWYAPPLPIELNYFEIEKNQKTAQLQWAVSAENTTRDFHIFKSSNGAHWEEIGKEKSNSSRLNYSWVDTNPQTGNNYYRLGMEDENGDMEYSEIKMVHFSFLSPVMVLYPNPSKGGNFQLSISGLENKEGMISFTNIEGKLVFQEKLTSQIKGDFFSTFSTGLNPGFYFVSFTCDGYSFQRKVSVE